MRRGQTGHEITVGTVGERVQAFVPAPLPPDPPLVLAGPLEAAIERATVGLGRLDGVSSLLPEPQLFLYTWVRKEAVLSSQIEGTQSSLSQLLLFELDEAPGVPIDDVTEVSRYVAALEHGLRRVREGFPLSVRLLREIHAVLLESGRGSDKQPGELRRSQNWIGGTRPGNAAFVPPPPETVPDLMSDLERYLHDDPVQTPTLLKAALAHAQFETIHPFLDGNGRVGRLLITLLLCAEGILREPLLYLSLYFKEHRSTYYALLRQLRDEGDWERWLLFFVEAVAATTEQAVATARALLELFASDRSRIQGELGRAAGSALQVHHELRRRPLGSIRQVHESTGLAVPTVTRAFENLGTLDMVREVTGRQWGRVFAYQRYLDLLEEGTTAPPG